MSKKKIKFLIPLGALLLTLIVLTGCRPSDALTRLMNAMNALNPSTEDMKTEDEMDENEPDENMDPIDEQRDDAKIEETEELIGQMLENMDWETAQESLMAVYSASATSNEWGAQQYNPDRLIYGSGNGNSPLVLNVKGDEVNSASKIAGSGEGSGNGTASVIETTDAQDDEGEETALPLTDPDENPGTTETTQIGPAEGEGGNEAEANKEGDPEGGGSVGSEGEDLSGDSEDDGGDSNVSYDPPDWPNAGSRIAATGELANIVCMLGGSDRLCATSESFRDNSLAREAFNRDDQMEYETPWTGDGSYYLSETDFVYLMEYLEPDICFDFNYTSFSAEQAARMADYGVTYVTMSALTTQSNINNCIKTVADKLGSDAQAVYTEYIGWVSNQEVSLSSLISDYAETVFIEDWDPYVETQFSIKQYNSSTYSWVATGKSVPVTTGAAVIKIGRSCRVLTDVLINANVYDWSASPHSQAATRNQMTSAYFGYGGGNYDGSVWWTEIKHPEFSGYATKTGDLCYVTPVMDELDGTTYTPYNAGSSKATDTYQQGGIYFTNGSLSNVGEISAVFETDNGSLAGSEGLSYGNLCLGYSDTVRTWKTVIVKNQYIKEQLDNNVAWQWNDNTGYYKKVTYEHATADSYCTPWSLNESNDYLYNMSYRTSVGGTYESYVNPEGLGNWVEGSPESILESIWAAWRIQGKYNESTVRALIQEFYSLFYGLDLERNGEEINGILAGPER